MVELTPFVNVSVSRITRSRTVSDQCKVGEDIEKRIQPSKTNDAKSSKAMAKQTPFVNGSVSKTTCKGKVHGCQLISKCTPMPREGDFCLAKVRGFVEWPSTIRRIENRVAIVDFFGANPNEKM